MSELVVSEVAPNYTLDEVRSGLAEASRMEVDVIRHPEVSTCYFLQNNFTHLIYNIVIWFFLAGIVACAVTVDNTVVVVLPGVFCLVFCVPYLAVSLEVPDFTDKAWVTGKRAEEIISQTVANPPHLTKKIVCFHTTRVKGGNELEFVTFKRAEEMQFMDWYDSSPIQTLHLNTSSLRTNGEGEVVVSEADENSKKMIKRIYIKPSYECANDETKEDFIAQSETMIDLYGTRDDNYRYTEHYSLPDIPSHILVNSDSNMRSFWFSFRTYLFCVFMGCAFPFRCILESCCVQSQVWVNQKILSANDMSASQLGDMQTDENVVTAEVAENDHIIDLEAEVGPRDSYESSAEVPVELVL